MVRGKNRRCDSCTVNWSACAGETADEFLHQVASHHSCLGRQGFEEAVRLIRCEARGPGRNCFGSCLLWHPYAAPRATGLLYVDREPDFDPLFQTGGNSSAP